MYWTFWVFIIFALFAGVVVAFVRSLSRDYKAALGTEGNKAKTIQSSLRGAKVLRNVLFALCLGLLISSMVYFVPVSNVGIVSAFSAPTGRTTGNGLAVVWPWQTVNDFDASVQYTDHLGDRPNCTNVRIGSMATACVENRVGWQLEADAAPKLYKQFKGDFDALKNKYVETAILNALNYVFATYNPLSQVNLKTGTTEFDGAKLATAVENNLKATIGLDIKIISVSTPLVHHDAQTEQNIADFQKVIAQARILEQQRVNAETEKQIAATQQSYLTPEFVLNKCIELSVKLGVAPGYCMMNGGMVSLPAK